MCPYILSRLIPPFLFFFSSNQIQASFEMKEIENEIFCVKDPVSMLRAIMLTLFPLLLCDCLFLCH